MTEKLKDVLCCGEPAEIYRDIDVSGKNGIGLLCHICENKCSNVDEKEAIKIFLKTAKEKPVKEIKKPVNNNTNKQITVISNPSLFAQSFHSREVQLMELVSPILSETSSMKRLINNNIRYVENANLDKIWTTKEGQDSIVKATEDAMMMGAELGKMGDLVPFGSTCQFIPTVEAFEFCLTNGNNAPFTDISIECIYENDKVKTGRKDGNFFLTFDSIGIPRGKVIAVAAYGVTRKGIVIGEVYDTGRLMAKAEAHSTSYQYYLRDKVLADQARSEGKIKTMNGGEYFEKDMGGQYPKKVFLSSLSNPYDGADQPEMLRKSAGKSFFGRFTKVRNSEAAMEEVRSSKNAMKQTMDYSNRQFDDDVIDI